VIFYYFKNSAYNSIVGDMFVLRSYDSYNKRDIKRDDSRIKIFDLIDNVGIIYETWDVNGK